MDASYTPTIILGVGILSVFLAVFGGGFQIKEISIPKLNNVSRGMGGAFGVAMIILWGQIGGYLFPENVKTPDQPVQILEEKVEPDNLVDARLTTPDKLAKKIDELKPLWDNVEIANKDLLPEYLKIREEGEFENLGVVHKAEVNNKIGELNESMGLVTQVDAELADKLKPLGIKIDDLEMFLSEDPQRVRLSKRDRERLEGEKAKYILELNDSAKIASENDLLICMDVVRRNCSGSKLLFRKGEVWVWFKIDAPQSTDVTLIWVNLENNEEVNSRTFEIPEATGYRVSVSKSLTSAGHYEARLFNKKNSLIARRRFEVR